MGKLEALFRITMELEGVLNQSVTAQNREHIIDRVNRLIEQRTALVDALQPPYTEEEKVIGKRLVTMNDTIQRKMNDVLHMLKIEMTELKKQKKSNQNYINPYKDVRTMDGMFMDSKK